MSLRAGPAPLICCNVGDSCIRTTARGKACGRFTDIAQSILIKIGGACRDGMMHNGHLKCNTVTMPWYFNTVRCAVVRVTQSLCSGTSDTVTGHYAVVQVARSHYSTVCTCALITGPGPCNPRRAGPDDQRSGLLIRQSCRSNSLLE